MREAAGGARMPFSGAPVHHLPVPDTPASLRGPGSSSPTPPDRGGEAKRVMTGAMRTFENTYLSSRIGE